MRTDRVGKEAGGINWPEHRGKFGRLPNAISFVNGATGQKRIPAALTMRSVDFGFILSEIAQSC